MSRVRLLQLIATTLALLTTIAAFIVWLPSTADGLTPYVLFPLFGLVAFGLMWGHYVMGALRRLLKIDEQALSAYWNVTSWIVLFCILAHPFLLEFQLYLDGLGLPPGSLFETYVRPIDRLALLAGFTALLSFLAFELYRWFQHRPWWKYIQWLNIAAMVLILWHGFTLGTELRSPWFLVIWFGYALSFAASVAYTGYHNRRKKYAATTII